MILLSTVVAPSFVSGSISLVRVDITPELLAQVTRNLCGHPVTIGVLKDIYPGLPNQEKAFWNGEGEALAIRPKGGVRGASATGDTQVTLDDLEAVLVYWHPAY